jgi:hypothetical protein
MVDDGLGENWFIELKDMTDLRVTNCKDMEEYSQKVEEFGQDYGGNIDTVNWYKDPNVPEYVMDVVRLEMSKFKSEMDEQKSEN